MLDEQTHQLIGELKGKLDSIINNQTITNNKIDAIDVRIGKIEVKAAKSGLITGAIAAIGISIIKEKLGI